MKKDIPEIDDLIAGINDPDVALGAIPQTTEEAPSLVMASAKKTLHGTDSDKCWQDFLSLLDVEEPATDKSGRLVCKLDRDLADSLEDCDICNRSRSDLVNAIVRAFFHDLPCQTRQIPPGEEIIVHELQGGTVRWERLNGMTEW